MFGKIIAKFKKNPIILDIYLLILKSNPILKPILWLKYKIEIKKRESLSFFDYRILSNNLDSVKKSIFSENTHYGNDRAVKRAIGKRLNYKYLIEHGYYFGNYVPSYSFKINNLTTITFSEQRLYHINESYMNNETLDNKRTVITIGPYINYAKGLLNEEEKRQLKKEYGKVLLVFPSHSIEGVLYKYNIDDFINEIEKVSKDFDSVFVCMYWKDIQDGRYVEYENKGYKIVTAGHRNDPNFLGRLKDIIDLSDMTMSNTVGTHIGYCVARNRPHYLFNQFQEVEGNKVEKEFKERRNYDYIKTRDEETGEVTVAFSSISYTITDEQKRVVEKYWGENKVEYHTVKMRDEI